MTLSITQRLTLTVAVLAGIVIGAAGFLVSNTLNRNIKTHAQDQASAAALEIEHFLWPQFDEDILFDFLGQRTDFSRLNAPLSNWAVVRGNGHVEAEFGALKHEQIVPNESLCELRTISGRQYAVASVLFKPEHSITWPDLPDEVQKTIETRVPDTSFLWAKSGDAFDQYSTFNVQMLGSEQIYILSVSDQGQILDIEEDPLVKTLPEGMEDILSDLYGIESFHITGWYPFDGALIATIAGSQSNGTEMKLGINRFGQIYTLDSDDKPVACVESSRLYVVSALDISQEQARTALFGRSIGAVSAGIWILMTLVAGLVTKRALRPVHDMVLQADLIMPSKLHERLPVDPANDELSRVARTVNHMLDRLQQGYVREQQFTGDVSHEMRNPLAKMIAEIDLALSKERDVAEYQETLKRLKGYSQGMQKLIDSLLMLARLEGGTQDLDIHSLDVADMVVETLKQFSSTHASRVQVELGSSAGPMIAIGHASLISVLISNLLDNALRYSPVHSPVHLRIHRKGKTLHFAIEDQGPGIPEDQKHLIFNRFHRIDKSRSQSTGGFGLGLAIVRAIAEVHHITVNMASGDKVGTVVSFSLPAQHEPIQN